MNRFLLSFLLLLAHVTLLAQKPGTPPVELPTDSAKRVIRRPNAATWEELRADRAFQYAQDVTPPATLWERLWREFLAWLTKWLYGDETKGTRDSLAVVFVVALLGYAVYQLIQMEKRGLFARRGTGLDVPYDVLSENIHAIPFDVEIAQAIEKQNFRLAVRLLYLKSLKDLSDRNLIRWQLDKTNRAYVGELANSPFQTEFERLTSRFEYVWYGDFPITQTQFLTLRAEFDAFRRDLPAVSSVA